MTEEGNTFNEDSYQSDNATFDMREAEYKTQIENLQSEKMQLTAQLEQVKGFMDKYNQISKENHDIKAENDELKRTNDDLQHRLQLSYETKQDLENQLKTEKEQHQQIRNNEYTAMNESMMNAKQNYENRISKLQADIETLREETLNKDIQNKLLVSKNDRLVQTATRYFGLSFPNIESLILRLEETPETRAAARSMQQTTPQSPMQNSTKSQVQTPTETTVQNLKQKNHVLKEKILETQEQITTLKDQLKKANQGNKRELNKLQATIDVMTQESATVRENHEKEVADLINQIKDLKTKNKDMEKQIQQMKTEAESQNQNHEEDGDVVVVGTRDVNPDEAENEADQLKEKHAKIQEIQERHLQEITYLQKEVREKLSNAEDRIQELEAEKAELIQSLKDSNDQSEDYKSIVNSLQAKVDSLNLLNDNYSKQIATLRQILLKKQESQEEEDKNDNQKNKATDENAKIIDQLQQKIDELSQEFANQQAKTIDAVNKNHEIQEELTNLKHQLEESQERVKDLEMDAKYRESKQSTEEVQIPVEAWHFSAFPSELNAAIDKIATNDALQDTSKLSSSYRCINDHFNKEIEKLNKKMTEEKDKMDEQKKKVATFVVDVSIAAIQKPTTLDDIQAGKGKEILDGINELRLGKDDLVTENENLKQMMSNIAEIFEVDSTNEEIIDALSEIRQRIELQTTMYEKTREKLKTVKQQRIQDQEDFQKKIDELEQENNKLLDEKDVMTAQLNQTKTKLQQTQNDYNMMTRNLSAEITERDIQLDDKVEEEKSILVNKMQTEFDEVKNELSDEIKNLKSKQVELQSEVNHLQRQLEEKSNDLEKSKQENDALLHDFNQYRQTSEDRFEKEKLEMKNQYDATIKAMGQRCTDLSNDIAKFAEELSQAEAKYNKLQKEKGNLSEEKRKLQEEKKRIIAAAEREKMLAEAMAKTKVIEEQAAMNEKLLEIKSKNEDEKKKLMNCFADKFRNFFSPLKAVDELEYKIGIEKAYAEYDKLMKADDKIRRLLSAKKGQTTPDAVAQIIVNNDIKV